MGSANVDSSKINQWQKLSWHNVRSKWSDNFTHPFRFDFEGMAANKIAYIDDAMLIDLTAAFGAGNEPTKEWCDINIEYFAGNKIIQYEAPNKYDLTVTTPTKIQTGDILNCPYSGSMKSVILPKGTYVLECWGAQGGNGNGNTSYPGGKGGYSKGTITLDKKNNLYLYTGGQGLGGTTYNSSGATTAGGFNGGGSATSQNSRGSGGGGTDIRIGTDSLYARVLVAGGGSGSSGYVSSAGFAGGGTSGKTYNNANSSTGSGYYGGGGSQTGGGAIAPNNGNYATAGSFGQGGNYNAKSNTYYGSGGGGGWYGGGGAIGIGGGGSGYMYTASSASYYPSGCLLNSQYYLENATTLAGNTAFTSPTGTSETGHTGNGYIRITVIEADSGNTLVKTTSNTWKEQKQMFVNTGASSTISSELIELDYIKPSSTQYINTQFIPTGNTRVIFTFEPTVTDNQALYTGGRTAASGTDAKTFSAFYISKAIRRDYYGTSKTTTTTYDINTKITVDANKNTTLINNSSALANFTLNTSTTSVMPIILFIAANQSSSTSAIQTSSSGAQYKFYSCKIYNNETLVRDFIPAKRTSDDKCGLWDKVNFKFYTDENGGNFTAGTEKSAIATIGIPIEYLESNGTQYIDTGVLGTNIKNVKVDFQFTSTQSTTEQEVAALFSGSNKLQIGWNASSFISSGGATYSQTAYSARTIANASPIGSPTITLYLFAQHEGDIAKHNSSVKIYSCVITTTSGIIYNFIPIKTTTNIYGLWDKVNKVFYPNIGTGTFTGGSAVSLSGWRKIKGIWTKTAADTWSQTL